MIELFEQNQCQTWWGGLGGHPLQGSLESVCSWELELILLVAAHWHPILSAELEQSERPLLDPTSPLALCQNTKWEIDLVTAVGRAAAAATATIVDGSAKKAYQRSELGKALVEDLEMHSDMLATGRSKLWELLH